MKIAILHNLPPGGALRFVEETARRLARSDDVVVLTWDDEPDPQWAGIEQRWLPPPRVHFPPPLHPFGDQIRSVVGSRRVAGRVNADGFDVAIVHPCRWTQAPAALRSLEIPFVYYAHEGRRRSTERGYVTAAGRRGVAKRVLWGIGRPAYDFVGRRLDRRAMRGARNVATNSSFTAANLSRAYGVDATVIEPGVDATTFVAGTHERGNAVLVVAALDPTKGIDVAVDALALLPEAERPELRVVANRGSDDYGSWLERRAAERKVHLVLRRDISDDELASEYRSARSLVATAVAEPFGMTIPEASACGTPVVAVDEGGYGATVSPGVNGTLVPRTIEGVAAGLDLVLRGKASIGSYELSRWAHDRWSWDACATELRHMCEGVAGVTAA